MQTAVKLIETRIDNINLAPAQRGSPQPPPADETAAGPSAPAAAQEAAAAAAGTSAPGNVDEVHVFSHCICQIVNAVPTTYMSDHSC